MNKDLYPTLHPQVASTLVDDQAVVVLADSGQVMVLNELSARIWQLCDGTRSVEEITQIILKEYEVEAEIARMDTNEFLAKMVEMQAIVLQDKPFQ